MCLSYKYLTCRPIGAVGHDGESQSSENIVFPFFTLCCCLFSFFRLSLRIYSVVLLVVKCFDNSLMLSLENTQGRNDPAALMWLKGWCFSLLKTALCHRIRFHSCLLFVCNAAVIVGFVSELWQMSSDVRWKSLSLWEKEENWTTSQWRTQNTFKSCFEKHKSH